MFKGRRWVLRYEDHEVVFANSASGYETVYLDGEIVNEKRNSFSTRAAHKLNIGAEEFELRVWGGLSPNVALYRGSQKIDHVKPEKSDMKKWSWFIAGCFIGGFLCGYFISSAVFSNL